MMAIVGIWILNKLKKVWVYIAAMLAIFGVYEDIKHKGAVEQKNKDDKALNTGEIRAAKTIIDIAQLPDSLSKKDTEEELLDGKF